MPLPKYMNTAFPQQNPAGVDYYPSLRSKLILKAKEAGFVEGLLSGDPEDVRQG